jgi:hypothetical protein
VIKSNPVFLPGDYGISLYSETIREFFNSGALAQHLVCSEADVCWRLKAALEVVSPGQEWLLELTVPILDEQLKAESRPTSDLVLPSAAYRKACGDIFIRISRDIVFRRDYLTKNQALRAMLDQDHTNIYMADCVIEVKFQPFRDIGSLRTGLAKDFNTLNLWHGLAGERVAVLVAVDDDIDTLVADKLWLETGEKNEIHCVTHRLKEPYKII